MPEPVHPDFAATVALVRSAAAPVEVLLLRRLAELSFLGGAYVFPGGRVDAGDEDAVAGVVPSGRFREVAPAQEAGVLVAAIRELVEEAGVLLARRDGAWATASEAVAVREALAAGRAFGDVIEESGWSLATDALVPFGWIVTPRAQPKRFDTFFLLAPLPPGQEATHDDGVESDDLVWVDPAAVIETPAGHPFAITPPTWFTIALLAQHRTIEELTAWARGREIERIEPRLAVVDDVRRVTFPNDPILGRWHGPDGISFEGRLDAAWNPRPAPRQASA